MSMRGRTEMKISVIIPVYNIEKFIERCVNSIINQTYKNLEIILVDDGSTDNSGKICDEFAKKDSRIIVIHKSNKGLSDTRNIGIEKATGDYLSFIDGDDWIEKDTYEQFLLNNKEINADLIVFGMSIDYEDGTTKIKYLPQKEILDNKKGLIYLNSFKNIEVSSCNKIYKKELFSNIRFPVGKLCEDYYIMYKLFDKSKKIMILPITKYHYFQRINSITKNKKVNMDFLYAAEEQMIYIEKKYPDISHIARSNYAFSILTIYNVKCKKGLLNERKERIRLVKSTKKYIKDVLLNKDLFLNKKIQFLMFYYLNVVYYFIIKMKK